MIFDVFVIPKSKRDRTTQVEQLQLTTEAEFISRAAGNAERWCESNYLKPHWIVVTSRESNDMLVEHYPHEY